MSLLTLKLSALDGAVRALIRRKRFAADAFARAKRHARAALDDGFRRRGRNTLR
ncbi:hypothetical protein KKP04_09485 [Rhodomicrobium sp. Az07]|uniref:hypothetical protein n=1 Tax=Rhodomicrobium sp. Az07 TaxID=2839034 RepID=UPI001BE72630|nr:hypothetical protein [Rhodomicrobium sp. Az07]MBT3071101.1 hypothetical protein [Rhodomicrobium sp. Az07]